MDEINGYEIRTKTKELIQTINETEGRYLTVITEGAYTYLVVYTRFGESIGLAFVIDEFQDNYNEIPESIRSTVIELLNILRQSR